eukprot:PhF_6_TR34598/c0_g1_i1/m.50385
MSEGICRIQRFFRCVAARVERKKRQRRKTIMMQEECCRHEIVVEHEDFFEAVTGPSKLLTAESAQRRALGLSEEVERRVVVTMFYEGLVLPPIDLVGEEESMVKEYCISWNECILKYNRLFVTFYEEKKFVVGTVLTRRVSALRGRSLETKETGGRVAIEHEQTTEYENIVGSWLLVLKQHVTDVVAAEAMARVEAQVGALQALSMIHHHLREVAKETLVRLEMRSQWVLDVLTLDQKARVRIEGRELEERKELWSLFRRRHYDATWEDAVQALYSAHRAGRDAIMHEEEWRWVEDFSADTFKREIEELREVLRKRANQKLLETSALQIWPKIEELLKEEVRARARVMDEESINVPKPPWRQRKGISRLIESISDSRTDFGEYIQEQ